MTDDAFYNRVGNDRITSRQIDELIGLASGLIADGKIEKSEIEFLQKWLAANSSASDQPMIRVLYRRVSEILADGLVDEAEKTELLDTLGSLSNRDFELGELLKPTTLPLCRPPPRLTIDDKTYCFTGTFNYGQRKHCEEAIEDRGGYASSLSQSVNVLVIGAYVTDSWKHSTFGNKILKACEWREKGIPISIVAEDHWVKHL